MVEKNKTSTDEVAARLLQHQEVLQRFADTGDPDALGELLEKVTDVKVVSGKVKRGRRRAAG